MERTAAGTIFRNERVETRTVLQNEKFQQQEMDQFLSEVRAELEADIQSGKIALIV